jgi:hypothetical protein
MYKRSVCGFWLMYLRIDLILPKSKTHPFEADFQSWPRAKRAPRAAAPVPWMWLGIERRRPHAIGSLQIAGTSTVADSAQVSIPVSREPEPVSTVSVRDTQRG